MASRLARRAGKTPSQSLQVEDTRLNVPKQDEEGGFLKKSPRCGSLSELAAAWAQGLDRKSQDYSIAQELKLRWREITPETLMPGQIKQIMAEWPQRYARCTVANRRNALKRFLTFVDRRHGTFTADAVHRVPPSIPRHVIATNEEILKLLAIAPTWIKAIIYFARGLGMRRAEITNLTPANFDPKTAGLNFKRKLGGSSNLPVPQQLQNLINFAASIDPHERIIYTLGLPRSKRSPLTAGDGREKEHEEDCMNSTITDHWRRLVKRAGVNSKLHIHDLRHTAATEVFNLTKDIRTAQQLLGHSSMHSTMRYIAPLGDEKIREQLATLNHEWLFKLKPLTQVKQ